MIPSSTLRRRKVKKLKESKDGLEYDLDKGQERVQPEFICCFCGCLIIIVAMQMLAWCAFAYSTRVDAFPVDTADIEADGLRWVRMPDGRVIEYGVCGHPNSKKVLYGQHGYGLTASFTLSKMNCKWADQNGVYIIAPTMPGFGYSDSYPISRPRSLTDWSLDVKAVLDKEDITGNFYVYGVSAGCVHAAAVAAAFPERINGILFSVPTAPIHIEAMSDKIDTKTRLLKILLRVNYIGDLIAYFIGTFLTAKDLIYFSAPDIRNAISRFQKEGYEDTAEELFENMDRAVRHTYRGWKDNMHVISDPIPFDMKSISSIAERNRKVIITTSSDDTTNPPIFHQWFHVQIPGSRMLTFEPGYGHVHLLEPENWRRAMKEIGLGLGF
eukprot:CAMPEP_0167749848 /NCGR_PEP_ID=MMETSP0110_2-20121227/5646_1 /TAXON_ID=629695 /ORGANISM="Gymnochlora sp., Strain CCMP2014" /LENGTH=382 /DNA_ID=CAMNT_0007635069 /DNA_START=55 /DNA_END=1203 /DNA_ORIENTATION=+